MRASGPLGGVNSRRAMVISPLPRWACHGCAKPTQRRQAIYLPLAVAKALWTARGSDVVGVIQFDWVWLSTDAQVSALVDSYRSASLGTKLLGRYNFRNDAAHIRGFLIPCARIPLIFVAEGALTTYRTPCRVCRPATPRVWLASGRGPIGFIVRVCGQ